MSTRVETPHLAGIYCKRKHVAGAGLRPESRCLQGLGTVVPRRGGREVGKPIVKHGCVTRQHRTLYNRIPHVGRPKGWAGLPLPSFAVKRDLTKLNEKQDRAKDL
jgi:hypothetical protein